MRVRLGFVSNSSSSSFILYSAEDRDAAYIMFLAFLRDELDAVSSYLDSGYATDIESVIQKFHDSLFRIETDEDRLKEMIQECIYYVASLYVNILADKKCLQYMKANRCPSCTIAVCNHCVDDYKTPAVVYRKLWGIKSSLLGVKLMPYFRDLKARVSEVKLEFRKDYPLLYAHHVYDDLETRSEEFANAWLAANPQATIMEFHSDNKDHTEAVLRFTLLRFTKYCRKRGLRCLHVDYS